MCALRGGCAKKSRYMDMGIRLFVDIVLSHVLSRGLVRQYPSIRRRTAFLGPDSDREHRSILGSPERRNCAHIVLGWA